MARRRRLSPLGPVSDDTDAGSRPPAPPPIAQVAGDAAIRAAFDEVSGRLRSAEAEGRMVRSLPLSAVVEDYLIRDRVALDEEEMQSLVSSLQSRGQQTPVEVVALAEGRFGLISGWRRCQALRQLAVQAGTDPDAAQVQALIRRPEDRAAAYVAMVEENEIRADLSFYERARVVHQALADGAFESEKQALQSLFAATSWSRRSKIKSFLPIVAALEGHLRFPARIPERLGLALSKSLAEATTAEIRRLGARLDKPATAAEEERGVIEGWMKEWSRAAKTPRSAAPDTAMTVTARPGRVVIEGPDVNDALIADLRAWLAGR
jgi:ParB family chromosome partitioning protein